MTHSSGSLSTSKKRVLIVDDDERILQFLSFFLREDGYEVGVAFDGPEGLIEFQRQRWDLIITDRLMREMNGIEMTGAIKGINPDFPVILIQGTPDLWTDRNLFAAVLAKPFRRQHILDVVREVLQNQTSGLRV
jgi:DNA-binding NtrC family response regulator